MIKRKNIIINCNIVRQQAPNKGYSNLLSHLDSKHPTYREDFTKWVNSTQQNLVACGFVNVKAKNIYMWINWVIVRNMPFSVDNEFTRGISYLKPICSGTLLKYMSQLTMKVGSKITEELPDTFGLLLDGWSNNGTHFVCIFAVYGKDTTKC